MHASIANGSRAEAARAPSTWSRLALSAYWKLATLEVIACAHILLRVPPPIQESTDVILDCRAVSKRNMERLPRSDVRPLARSVSQAARAQEGAPQLRSESAARRRGR